jgi:trehalase-like protein
LARTRSPIEDYALVGDCETAALISRGGSIDWLCWPRFDSGACCAALLGGPENGRWLLAPRGAATIRRRYRSDTLILETEFTTRDGSATLIDFMPMRAGDSHVVRLIVGRRGTIAMRTELVLRFDYGLLIPWVTRLKDGRRSIIAGPDRLILSSEVPLRGENLKTVGEFEVCGGQTLSFVLTYRCGRGPPGHNPILATLGAAGFRCGRVHRCSATLSHYAQGSDLPADRRDPGSGHYVFAGGDRRCTQLGLPLLLAAGRDVCAPGHDEQRAVR